MIVLVPLSRFRIAYEVAAGRPFSQFERLILRAIKEGASELSELRATFQVHPRLLIEGLVTLTHAGWLAIGGPGHEGFVLTAGGHEAAASDQPPSTIDVTGRQASVVMERLSGALIANSEVRFASRRDLGDVWDRALRLSPEVTGNQLDEGQVQHLLPRRQGEWLRWIGPIDMLTKGANWLPVDVDIRSGNVIGLPDSWAPRLQAAIILRASEAGGTKQTEALDRLVVARQHVGKSRPTVAEQGEAMGLQGPGSMRPTIVSEEDFCFTEAQHESLLTTAMNEAQSSVFIASSLPNTEKLEYLRDGIEAAVKRGVNVDLLFGELGGTPQELRAAIDWASKVAYEARQEGAGGLRFSRQASNFNGNLLLWDGTNDGSACVGSYRWLAVSENRGEASFPGDVSVRISEPGSVAALARCAVGFWASIDNEMLSSTADRWRGIAAELDRKASGEAAHNEANANVCLVVDGEHETLIDQWKSTAQSRVLAASHELGSVSRILKVERDNDSVGTAGIDIVYGWTDRDQDWLADAARRLERRNGSLRQIDDFRGKVLIKDELACITSYNVLSAACRVGANKGRELGIVIEGRELVQALWRKFKSE